MSLATTPRGALTIRTTYSLPGHVLIAVPALPSTLDGKVRAIRHLVIKVEGKSEFFDEEGEARVSRVALITRSIHPYAVVCPCYPTGFQATSSSHSGARPRSSKIESRSPSGPFRPSSSRLAAPHVPCRHDKHLVWLYGGDASLLA